MTAGGLESIRIDLTGAPCWEGPRHARAALARKDAALFALLALAGDVARDRVAAWLWPEVPLANARLNLRQRLHKLRGLSGHALVRSGEHLLGLPGLAFELGGEAQGAKATAPLLAALDFADLPEFDRWLRGQRRRIVERQVEQLAAEVAQAESEGSLPRAIDNAQRAVALAPWLEHNWRRLMRLHHLHGDRAAAVAAFERFEHEVCADSGLRPAAETLELLRTIERAEAPRHGTAPLPVSLVRPPRLVGRTEALHAVRAAWDQRRGVLLAGAAGIGKTRLLDELMQGQRGVLRVRARAGDAGTPYATAGALLHEAIERFAPALDESARAQLARLLPGLGPAAASAARQPALWAAIDALLQACREHGLRAVVIDDLHLADAATLELLRWLLPQPQETALRWLLAGRPDEGTGPLTDWAADSATGSARLDIVTLGALGCDDLRELLDSLDLPMLRAAGRSAAEALFRHAGGHPFYTLETLKAMVLSGATPEQLPSPPTVSALIERRLSRTSAPARKLLALLAVAGADLPPAVAAEALGCTLMDLAPAWRELEQAQVLGPAGFAHDLVRDAALAQVPQALRPALHATVARVLRAQASVAPARLAEHCWQAGLYAEAAAAWLAASRHSRHTGRLGECAALVRRAAQAFERAGDAESAFASRCDALAASIVLQGDAQALQAIDALQPQAMRPAQQARLELLRAECLMNLMQFDAARRASEHALALAAPGNALAADALSLHGRALAMTGAAPEGVVLLERAVAAAQAEGDGLREATAGAALAHALLGAHRRGAALHAQARVVELARGHGDDTELATHLANLATLAMMTGDVAATLAAAREAAQRLKSLGAGGAQLQFNAIVLARAAAAAGALDEAHAALQASSVPAEPAANLATMAAVAMAGICLWLGQPERGLAQLPADDPGAHPLARAGLLLARHRLLRAAGGDATAVQRDLFALDQARPTLFDDPALCLEIARVLPAAEALRRLRRVRLALRGKGCEGLERTLLLRELQRGEEITTPRAARRVATARRLAQHLPMGLFATQYPPEAWWVLTAILSASDAPAAERCRQQALEWLRSARLPDLGPDTRERFERDNPLNRAVLASAPITAR